MIKSISTIIFSIMILNAFGQSIDGRIIGIELEIDSLMKAYNTVGLSIAIVEDNDLIYSKGFGYRNYQEKLPVTANTQFPIGSVTKPFTASLIGVFQGKEKLSIDDQPKKHIKDLQFYSDEMNNIVTIGDLLSHKSGIGVVDGTHVFFPKNDLGAHLERLAYLIPNSKVRERFDYSNMGYAILGGIIEKISKKTWSENMKREIFDPLGMSNSNTTITDLKNSQNYSLGYSVANNTIVKVQYEDQHESVASGAINSTANDLSIWVSMLLNSGKHKDQQIIPKKYLESSFSEHNVIRGSFSFDKKYDLLFDTYGYGWFVHQNKGLYRVNHEGNVSGFTASINLIPHKNIGIIILTNQGAATLLTKAINDIITNRLLNLEQKNWKSYDISIGEANLPIEKMKPINEDKKPGHSLDSYCGKYINPGYGVVNIIEEDESLIIEFPAFRMALEHQYYNTSINKVIAKTHQNTPSFYMTFYSNNEGVLSDMTIGMQAEPVKFKKSE